MDRSDIMDVSNINFSGDFNDQVRQILRVIRLSYDDVTQLSQLYNDLKNDLDPEWPGCQVKPFGSIITGLGIKTSDADCFIEVPANDPQMLHSKKFTSNCVKKARKILGRNHWKYDSVFAIVNAKVPIVKFRHIPTQFECDISFSSAHAVHNSKLIGCLLQMDKRLLPLTVLIKYWSKVHKLSGTNLLSNYALIMMVIFYLQCKGILPSVKRIQYTEPVYDDYWDISFDASFKHTIKNNEPLHKLLGGFFKFYNNFNFKDKVISPFVGYELKRDVFKRFESIPREFELYIGRLEDKSCLPLIVDSEFCVQDVFQHSRNVAVAVHSRLANHIKAYIRLATDLYENCNGKYETYLYDLLTLTPPGVESIAPVVPQRNNMIPNRIRGKVVIPNQKANNKRKDVNWKINLNNTGNKKLKK